MNPQDPSKDNQNIPGGSIILARQIRHSPIWGMHPLYHKIWTWSLLEALYEDGFSQGIPGKRIPCKRGQFATTWKAIGEANAYTYNREKVIPQPHQVRNVIDWLVTQGSIRYEQLLEDRLGQNTGRPTGLTRAYIGIKITIVKYDFFQQQKNYRGRRSGRPSPELGQLNTLNEVNEKKRDTRDEERPASLVPLKGKSPKQRQLNPQVEELLEDWKTAVKQHPKFGTEPEITNKDRAVMAKTLRKWPPDLIQTLFEFHLDSWKANKSGPSLSTAFSEDSYNSFTREWKNSRFAYGDAESPLTDGLRWWNRESREEKKYREEHGNGRRQHTTSLSGV